MNQSTNAGVAFGSCPTPEKLAPDVDVRDGEWERWEKDAFQAIVNQAIALLSANYPGKGWFEVNLSHEYHGAGTHGQLVRSALHSAFGENFEGIIEGLALFFPTKNWRVSSKYESSDLRLRFQPAHEPTTWRQRRGWISPVATISEHLKVSAMRLPPSSIRPNRRGVTGLETGGISTEATAGAQDAGVPFPYENLC